MALTAPFSARKLRGLVALASPTNLVAGEQEAPAPLVHPALRLWGVCDAVFGIVLGLVVAFAIPWKTPFANALLLAFAGSLLLGAPFLYRGQRWAYRLAVVTSLVGLAAAVLLVLALVSSWAYLRASYGVFGAGASLGALLIAGIVVEVLGLYPALRLHGLLRTEVRRTMRAGRAAVLVALALVVLPLPVGIAVHQRYRLSPQASLDESAAAASLAYLRGVLSWRTGAAPSAPAAASEEPIPAGPPPFLFDLPLGPGPVFVSVWDEGQVVARAAGTGASLGEALRDAATRLVSAIDRGGLGERAGRGRLKLDRSVARGPVLQHWPLAFALGIDPGLDGLLGADDQPVFLGDDVLRAGVAGTSAPIAFLSELRLGVSVDWMDRRIRQAGARAPFSRVRTEGWLEPAPASQPGGAVRIPRGAVRIYRGNVWSDPSGTPAMPAASAGAAVAGGDYLLRQVETDGRLRYRYDPYDDAGLGDGSEYSLARHAGAAYCLAQLFGTSGAPRFGEGAQHALAWLALQMRQPCGQTPGTACLVDNGRVSFGPTALSAIAMFEYQRRTGDRRYEELASGIAAFLASQQRPDGEFEHGFDPGRGATVPGPPKLFASEQAALALVLADRVAQQPGARAAAERALDFLTHKKYDFFLGRFIFGADHWTCIAAEEAWPALKHRHYLQFCSGLADFMRRLQYPPMAHAAPRDFAGHYGFGYQMVPQAPATAGFTEALLSTVALARHHGVDDRRLADDARAALRALLREQLSSANTYLARNPARAVGGFRRSLVEPEVRIDFVQHATSALARAEGLGLSPL